MFWGLVLEPSKKYTQKVEQAFHISQATLELKSADLEPVQVLLEFQGSNFILATLSKKHNIFQVPLDLNFEVGDQISFRLIGKARVHLTGYHVMDDDDFQGLLQGENEDSEDEELDEESSFNDTATPGKRKKALTKSNEKKKKKLDTSNEDQDEDEDTDSDDESYDGLGETTFGDTTLFEEDDDSDLEDESGEEEEEDEDDEDLEEEEEDESEEETVPTPKSDKKKKENQVLNASVNGISSSKKDKKNKFKTEVGSPQKETPKKDGQTPKKDKQGKTPKQDGSQKKTPKSEKGLKQEPKTPNTPSSPGSKKVLEGGVVIEELQVGEGPVAKPGKMAQVYYSGRLKSNNKLFDSATQGPGFRFRLGKGEVIKGWDIGVNGMKVGGKRKIVIPSALAYGAKGSPPAIPPNSTLVFEVELRGVN